MQYEKLYSKMEKQDLYALEPMEKLCVLRLLVDKVARCSVVDEYSNELLARKSTLRKRLFEEHRKRNQRVRLEKVKQREKEAKAHSEKEASDTSNKENLGTLYFLIWFGLVCVETNWT